MLYLFRLLLILINIDQETVLNWFGIKDPNTRDIRQAIKDGYDFNLSNIEPAPNVSLETFRLIVTGLWEKIQDGLTLADIENLLFFILFVRFIILAIKYNLKTSFYITCIGLLAGYLWYRHLIDLLSVYRNVLLQIPFLNQLGIDGIQLRSLSEQLFLTDGKLEENVHWYDPVKLLYNAFLKGIKDVDLETGDSYYIDPISMVISTMKQPNNSTIVTLYYSFYNKTLPNICNIISKFWTQLSGVVAYTVITRVGRRYCPYLIRWHWTFLILLGFIEQVLIFFVFRIYYFQVAVLTPEIELSEMSDIYITPNLLFQENIVSILTLVVVVSHLGLVFFGLFHAIWGQYFYVPLIVENIELHIGPRPIGSVYSGGNTAWQDPKEKRQNGKSLLPKLWYGWFGSGTEGKVSIIKRLMVKFLYFVSKKFARLLTKILLILIERRAKRQRRKRRKRRKRK